MKTSYLILAVLGISVALALIFKLVFVEVIALMIWNIVAGIVATVLLSLNLVTVTSIRSLTMRNAAALAATNTLGVALFVWTLVFTFAMGDFKDAGRGLTTLYIGYLVLLIVCGAWWYMANQGGAVAETQVAATQQDADNKQSLISTLRAADFRLALVQPRLHKALSIYVDMLRALPNSKTSDSGLASCVTRLHDAVASNDVDRQRVAVEELGACLRELKAAL